MVENGSEAGDTNSESLAKPPLKPATGSKSIPGEVVSDLLEEAMLPNEPQYRDFGERYKYLSVLGQGGQGIVIAALDHVLEREVALKTIKEHANSIREEHLTREAKISGHLEHPNIPPVYDLDRDESGTPFFVMRKVEGISLDTILHRKNNTADSRPTGEKQQYSRLHLLSIFIQICNAIEYAHSHGVLHLDIKPQNIKLGTYGEVFVLDWGFASRKDEVPQIVGGTPIYIAPERLKRKHPDERSDVYSLGVLLYRILTGSKPYEVANLTFKEYCADFDKLTLIPPRQRDSSIPRELDAIVCKAMSRLPDNRYTRVHILASDLQRFLDDVPVSAYRISPPVRVWKAIKRHKLFCLLIGTLLIAILSIMVNVLFKQKLQHERQVAVRATKLREKQQQLRSKANIPMQKAMDFMEKNPPQLESSLRFFSLAITLDPAFADAYFERGKTHFRLGSMTEALADFRQTLALKPNYIMAHYYSGIIHMDVTEFKDLKASEYEFTSMQKIDRNNEYSNLGLARLHILARNFTESLKLIKKIEQRNPDISEVHYLRGSIYGSKKSPLYNPKLSLLSYDRYLDVSKDDVSAYLNRGDLRLRQNNIDGALQDYNAALKINPDYIWALNNRGYIYYSVKLDIKRALADFNHAAESRPEYYWTYMNRGAVYEYLQQWHKAETDYNWALDLKPEHSIIRQRQAQCFYRQGKFELSLQSLQKILQNQKTNPKPALLYNLALVNFALANYKQALAWSGKAIDADYQLSFYAAILQNISALYSNKSPDPAILTTLAKQQPQKPWLLPLAKYWQGLIPKKDVVITARNSIARCEIYFYLGMYQRLIKKNNSAAAMELKKCRNTLGKSGSSVVHLLNEFTLAGVELQRLDKSKK